MESFVIDDVGNFFGGIGDWSGWGDIESVFIDIGDWAEGAWGDFVDFFSKYGTCKWAAGLGRWRYDVCDQRSLGPAQLAMQL